MRMPPDELPRLILQWFKDNHVNGDLHGDVRLIEFRDEGSCLPVDAIVAVIDGTYDLSALVKMLLAVMPINR